MKKIKCLGNLSSLAISDRKSLQEFISNLQGRLEVASIYIAQSGHGNCGVCLEDKQISLLLTLLKELKESI